MVLGTRISPDTVDVENIESENGDFVANFKILAFQKRMRVSHTIGLEFIAKGKILLCWLAYIYLMTPYCVLGRMWCLSFSITHNSDWSVMLSISDRSPATWVDSHIIIEEPPQSSAISAPVASSLIDCAIQEVRPVWQQSQKVKPKIDIRLQTEHYRLSTSHPIDTILIDTSLASSLRYE
jgi:hypothetical protein